MTIFGTGPTTLAKTAIKGDYETVKLADVPHIDQNAKLAVVI